MRKGAMQAVVLRGRREVPPITLPQYMLTAVGTQYEGFDTFADWTASQGTIANDAVNVRAGTASLNCLSGSGTSAGGRRTITNKIWGSGPRMRLKAFMTNTGQTELANIRTAFTSAGSAFTTYYGTIIGRSYGAHYGWNTIDIYPADWTTANGENWANTMNRFRIINYSNASQISNVSYDTLIQDIVGYPGIVLSFDDCLSDLYTTIYPLLKQYQMVGTAYVITDLIGTPGHCTAAQIQEMNASGVICLGNHTKAHTNLNTQNEADQTAAIEDAMTALTALGITTGEHLAYPFGGWNETTLTVCRALGIKTARTVQHTNLPILDADQIHLLSSYPVVQTDSLATIQAYIAATKTNMAWDWLQFHQIVTSPASAYQWATADFTALLDYIKAQGVRTLRVDELYNTLAGQVTIRHY